MPGVLGQANEESFLITGDELTGFLIDENLPRRLSFVPSLPFVHSSVLGDSPTDSMIWDYARMNALVIVTKDADFFDRIMLSSPPPWVVHLKFGNMRRRDYQQLLAQNWTAIEGLLRTNKLISVYRDRIESFSD